MHTSEHFTQPLPEVHSVAVEKRRRSVLFLCTANAIRSQMAEGFLKAWSTDFDVFSAGSQPCGYVDKYTIEVMKEVGIDISSHTSKPMDVFKDQPVDVVVTVCSSAYEACPAWLYENRITAHWGFKDVSGKSKKYFRLLRDELGAHLKKFLSLYSADQTDGEVQSVMRKLLR